MRTSARLTALHLAGAGLTADASGSFGYGPSDPVAIALHAQSDDVALLAKSLGAKLDISGALATTLDASGSRNAPRVAQTIDATNFRYAQIHVAAPARPTRRRSANACNCRRFEADLVRGRLLASATLPIRITAPVGLRNDPLTASLTRRGHRPRAVRDAAAEQRETRRHDRRPDQRARHAERSRHRRNADPRRRQLLLEPTALGRDQRRARGSTSPRKKRA